ncbi:hypothetical protein D3C87_1578970 [compost metagenome]
MIGNRQALAFLLRQVERGKIFGDVLRECRYPCGFLRIGRIKPQHMAVVLDGRAAAGCGDDDGIEATIFHFTHPYIDIAAGGGERLGLAPHMMHQRSAAAFPLRHDNLDAKPRQKTQRRLVDTRIEHRLGAAGKNGDTSTLFTFG